MRFPAFPANNQAIWDYEGPGEYMACTIVHKQTAKQLMAWRILRQKLGESEFRRQLCEGLDILSESKSIHTPGGWLYSFVKSEADNAK